MSRKRASEPTPEFGEHGDLAEQYRAALDKYAPVLQHPQHGPKALDMINRLFNSTLSMREPSEGRYAHNELMEQAEMTHERRQDDPQWKPSWAKW